MKNLLALPTSRANKEPQFTIFVDPEKIVEIMPVSSETDEWDTQLVYVGGGSRKVAVSPTAVVEALQIVSTTDEFIIEPTEAEEK